MKIKYTRDALKFLSKQTKDTVNRIRSNIKEKLTKKPPEGDIAPL